MQDLLPIAGAIGARLAQRRQTVAVAESSAGGLIAAALLALPGASAYFVGGAVVYTRHARRVLLDIPEAALSGIRPATEAYARLLATAALNRFGTDWALAETGAAGPTGNRYGDPAGHACVAVAGPAAAAVTIATGSADRATNMRAFAAAALGQLARQLDLG